MSVGTWAAIAAGCSAIAAFLSWKQQKKSNINTIRPQLMLEGWSLEDCGNRGKIGIKCIKNYGNGPAQRISGVLHFTGKAIFDEDCPTFLVPHKVSYIAPSEANTCNWKGTFFWDNGHQLSPSDPLTLVSLNLDLYFYDIDENQYQIIYLLIAKKPIDSNFIAGVEPLVPGLSIGSIKTKFHSRTYLTAQHWIRSHFCKKAKKKC